MHAPSASQELPAAGSGAGLGLRRGLLDELLASGPGSCDFIELAPENWIGAGGREGRRLAAVAEVWPLWLHGLSLNLGGQAPLDLDLIDRIASFSRKFNAVHYSEHLSACGDDGHLYELLPVPFTEEAVRHIAARIRAVQDALGQRISVENASYYSAPWQELSELEFILAVLEEADCELLLDVNNVFVNASNHGYDPLHFMAALPAARVRYMHVAGHFVEADGLRIDTHGAPVADPVWSLLEQAYRLFGPRPTLLERDFNLPALGVLLREIETIRLCQQRAGGGARCGHA